MIWQAMAGWQQQKKEVLPLPGRAYLLVEYCNVPLYIFNSKKGSIIIIINQYH